MQGVYGPLQSISGGLALVDVLAGDLRRMHWELAMTFSDIAKKLGVSVGTVHNLFKKHNVPARNRGHIPGNFKHSRETLLKISKAHKGKKYGASTRAKISKARKIFYKMGNHPPRWNGGKREKRSDGYIQIQAKNHPSATKEGYVLEHRLVMERVLGRFLLESEVVHHIDGNRKNNSPENLMVFSSGADHLRYHNFFRKRVC